MHVAQGFQLENQQSNATANIAPTAGIWCKKVTSWCSLHAFWMVGSFKVLFKKVSMFCLQLLALFKIMPRTSLGCRLNIFHLYRPCYPLWLFLHKWELDILYLAQPGIPVMAIELKWISIYPPGTQPSFI